MIIYISGVHGIGKTTLINNIRISEPLIKVLNIDYSRSYGKPGYKSQLIRQEKYFQVLKALNNINQTIIMDRAPESLLIYNYAHYESGNINKQELRELVKNYEKQARIINTKGVRILLKAPISLIKENIIKRGRSKELKEDDEVFLNSTLKYYKKIFKPDKEIIINNKQEYKKAVMEVERIINKLIK